MRQVLILGAGYDTLAFKMGDRNVLVHEVDLPSVQQRKLWGITREYGAHELVSGSPLNFIPCDFETESLCAKLRMGGVDPNIPTVVLLEGVSYYIDVADFEKTVSAVISHFTARNSRGSVESPSTSATTRGSEMPQMTLIMDFMPAFELEETGDWIWDLNKRQAAAFHTPFKTGFNDISETLRKLGLENVSEQDCVERGRDFLEWNHGPFCDGTADSVARHCRPMLRIAEAELHC